MRKVECHANSGPVRRNMVGGHNLYSDSALQYFILPLKYNTYPPLLYQAFQPVTVVKDPAYFHDMPLFMINVQMSCKASVTAPTIFASVPSFPNTMRTSWLATGRQRSRRRACNGISSKSPACATWPPSMIMLGF